MIEFVKEHCCWDGAGLFGGGGEGGEGKEKGNFDAPKVPSGVTNPRQYNWIRIQLFTFMDPDP